MKTLYFDCKSGISGDMTVAALLDLGLDGIDIDFLNSMLYTLPLGEGRICGDLFMSSKCRIAGSKFDVLPAEYEGQEDCGCGFSHDHDHEHEHDHEHGHDHPHIHESDHHVHNHNHTDCDCGHEHDHDSHDHGHDSHDHGDGHHNHDHHIGHTHTHADPSNHSHRGLHDIIHIFEHSGLTRRAKDMAIDAFKRLAKAEATVHGTTIHDVHFHEVGAVDSIADIASAAILIDAINPGQVLFSVINEGSGSVKCAHGIMPVPVPATLELLSSSDIPFRQMDAQGEMITPTGAVIAACFGTGWGQSIPVMKNMSYGVGCGTKDFPHANILRVYFGDTQEDAEHDEVVVLECNIDDMTPEALSFACERLLSAGALDVWQSPVVMKKGRAAVILSVLCVPSAEKELCGLILSETSTIGVRRCGVSRVKMRREIVSVSTAYGEGFIKVSSYGSTVKAVPEYESVKELSLKSGRPFSDIYGDILYTYQKGVFGK
ncbi:MAG: nickel pincer cofactor biosynthesis protein LarC [Eubacteriales bacterium]